jgi:hypothetical protein
MRACAWLCVGAGILSAVAAFIITAHNTPQTTHRKLALLA